MVFSLNDPQGGRPYTTPADLTEGWRVNTKRVHRLWRDEELQVRPASASDVGA